MAVGTNLVQELVIFRNASGTIIVPEGGGAVICEMLEEHLQQ